MKQIRSTRWKSILFKKIKHNHGRWYSGYFTYPEVYWLLKTSLVKLRQYASISDIDYVREQTRKGRVQGTHINLFIQDFEKFASEFWYM